MAGAPPVIVTVDMTDASVQSWPAPPAELAKLAVGVVVAQQQAVAQQAQALQDAADLADWRAAVARPGHEHLRALGRILRRNL